MLVETQSMVCSEGYKCNSSVGWILGCKTAGVECGRQKKILGRQAGFQIMEVQECTAINHGISWQDEDISVVIC